MRSSSPKSGVLKPACMKLCLKTPRQKQKHVPRSNSGYHPIPHTLSCLQVARADTTHQHPLHTAPAGSGFRMCADDSAFQHSPRQLSRSPDTALRLLCSPLATERLGNESACVILPEKLFVFSVCVEPEADVQCLPQLLSTLLFETASLDEPKTR